MDTQVPGPSGSKKTTKRTIHNPPFDSECEVFEEGEPDAKQRFDFCTKNPGHKDYIPVNKLTIDDLPEGCRSDKFMNAIKNCCDRTVKITMNYTSPNRPNTYPNSTAPYPFSHLKGSRRAVRCGTGVIYFIRPSKITNKPCPCHLCRSSQTPMMEYAKVEVFTAAHVVFDDSEAECTVCEVFYDSEDSNVKYLYGVKGAKNGSGGDYPDSDDDGAGVMEKCSSDKFFIKCVTHDMDLFAELKSHMAGIYSQYNGLSPLKFIVSHPHGCSKQIAFGKSLHYSIQLPYDHSSDSQLIIPVGMIIKCEANRFERQNLLQHPDFFTESLNEAFFFIVLQELKLCLPQDAPQTSPFLVKDDRIDWVEFPNGSKLTSINGDESFQFTNLRFYLPQWVNIFKGKFVSFFMTYDIATCAGCSGAQVVADNEELVALDWATHYGSLSSGRNRSGINKHYVAHTGMLHVSNAYWIFHPIPLVFPRSQLQCTQPSVRLCGVFNFWTFTSLVVNILRTAHCATKAALLGCDTVFAYFAEFFAPAKRHLL